jgi:hypothetical protein
MGQNRRYARPIGSVDQPDEDRIQTLAVADASPSTNPNYGINPPAGGTPIGDPAGI